MNSPIYFEYTKAAVPNICDLEINSLNPSIDFYRENDEYKKIITPNLEAFYINFCENNTIIHESSKASSHVFYVIKGNGNTTYNNNDVKWKAGDVFTFPFSLNNIKHTSYDNETVLFYANDSPLLKYLSCLPNKPRFTPTYYSHEEIMYNIKKYNSDPESINRNRNGALLSNKEMVDEKINTLTHTMWSLMNYIGPNTVQKPHRHNSIAIDLCTHLDNNSENKVYTLMSKEINEKNELINPIKVYWKRHCTFTTPPGWWHSHHNESNKEAWVFPVQDAGLHTHMRTLDILFKE